MPPAGRPAIRFDAISGTMSFVVYGGRLLVGEYIMEQEEHKRGKGKSDKAKRAVAAQLIEEGFWIDPEIFNRKGITYAEECLGYYANAYPRRQALFDFDRSNLRVLANSQLYIRNRKLLDAYQANDLNQFGRSQAPHTHPDNQPAEVVHSTH